MPIFDCIERHEVNRQEGDDAFDYVILHYCDFPREGPTPLLRTCNEPAAFCGFWGADKQMYLCSKHLEIVLEQEDPNRERS